MAMQIKSVTLSEPDVSTSGPGKLARDLPKLRLWPLGELQGYQPSRYVRVVSALVGRYYRAR